MFVTAVTAYREALVVFRIGTRVSFSRCFSCQGTPGSPNGTPERAMATVPGDDAGGTSVGVQILLAALANIVTSSSMAVFNAWIFRNGYHFQFSLIVVQQIVCSAFAFAQVTYLPGEKQKLRIAGPKYFRMLLPFAVIVAAKLYVQNKAFEYVSPAFYAMIASTLPVGVTLLAIARGIEPFRLTTLFAAVLVSVGGVLIKAGEISLSPFGLFLTCVALGLDVVRLVLMQYLVQPLKLTGPGVMLLSSPLQCLIASIGAVFFESTDVALSIMAGNFPAMVWVLLALNGGLAMLVNLVLFAFMKVSTAVVVAITTPFKDLAIIVMSDTLVVRRVETPMSIAGFALACATSLAYNVHNIFRKEREAVEKAQNEGSLNSPLIPARQEKNPGYKMMKSEEAKQTETDEDADPATWRYVDGVNALLTCCSLGILILATGVLAQLDPVEVARAYKLV